MVDPLGLPFDPTIECLACKESLSQCLVVRRIEEIVVDDVLVLISVNFLIELPIF